ncbi:hypothetical protein F3Y22_tig00111210pilonHSYRG00097 [Hibiscus syriacus]|uniref:SWIM-type domain-containing protein n=1 Tax=Hibiscus syriacus TaxID=106335 RepID=A0A6A2YVA4_HIBSY|nr:hypothetical protein F3Y22_tig00111210pilonHSYRG00097 [Hibiscus syriacus]
MKGPKVVPARTELHEDEPHNPCLFTVMLAWTEPCKNNVKPTEECHEVHNVDESDRLVGQLFSSRDQAWYFYKGFAWEHGFSAHKGTTRLDMEGNIKTQEFCYSKKGFRVSKVNTVDRQRAHTPITRIGCKARVVVTTTNTNDYWIISKSYQKHNHAFFPPAITPFMRSNRAVSKADIDEATALKKVGVGTSQVMNYLTQQAWGYNNVGFTYKDLYNALQRVVTDGDRAIQRAIKSVIPYAKHRLCSWHLSRNAQANIEFNVEKHLWVIEKGNTRHLWAQAYLTGHFFANIRSTQRCESMNASLAIALKHKKTYLYAVRAIEDGISRIRMNEVKEDYLSSQTKPFQITKLVDLESYDAEIFTRESFRAFQYELQRETLYQIEEEIQSLSDECKHYILTKYKEKNRTFEISFDSRTEDLICSCKKFETVGLLCHHQRHILKHLDYKYLPGTLIQSRWTKDAKASTRSYVDLNMPPKVIQMARFAALCSTLSKLCYIASKTDASFKTARDEMKRLIEEFENSFGLNDSVNQSSVVNNVRDPQQKQRK